MHNVQLLLGKYHQHLDDAPAGNIVGITGLDILVKYGTIGSSEVNFPIRGMKFSISPIVRVAIEPRMPSQLPIFTEALKSFVKSDPMVFPFFILCFSKFI